MLADLVAEVELAVAAGEDARGARIAAHRAHRQVARVVRLIARVVALAAAQTRNQNLQSELQTAQQRQTRYRELAQEIAVREAQDRQNQRVLPEQAEMSAFLQDIDRIAELSGLSVQVVEPRPEEPQDLYVRLPVTLQLRGRYHQIAKFFYNVSNLERAINMENLVLAEPESENDEIQLSVNVLATTFRRIGDEPRGETTAEGEAG